MDHLLEEVGLLAYFSYSIIVSGMGVVTVDEGLEVADFDLVLLSVSVCNEGVKLHGLITVPSQQSLDHVRG